ncbi:MAG: hypothetical protein J7K21_02300, partial [Desulfurococcales archaeon]|nr:hypothetical protein [Desulfurococcales archaeon]
VVYDLNVYVFVVGEWKVKDVQEIPKFCRQARWYTYQGPISWLGGALENLFTNPYTMFWGIVIMIIIVGIALIFTGFSGGTLVRKLVAKTTK